MLNKIVKILLEFLTSQPELQGSKLNQQQIRHFFFKTTEMPKVIEFYENKQNIYITFVVRFL